VQVKEPNTARLTCYGWREALHHHSADHYSKEISWVKLGEGALGVARELEQQLSDSISGEDPDSDIGLDPPSGLVVWMCAHCLDLPSQTAPQELYAVKEHVRDSHDVVDPQPEIDYYKDYEAPQGYFTDMPNMISLLGIDVSAPEEPDAD